MRVAYRVLVLVLLVVTRLDACAHRDVVGRVEHGHTLGGRLVEDLEQTLLEVEPIGYDVVGREDRLGVTC